VHLERGYGRVSRLKLRLHLLGICKAAGAWGAVPRSTSEPAYSVPGTSLVDRGAVTS